MSTEAVASGMGLPAPEGGVRRSLYAGADEAFKNAPKAKANGQKQMERLENLSDSRGDGLNLGKSRPNPCKDALNCAKAGFNGGKAGLNRGKGRLNPRHD